MLNLKGLNMTKKNPDDSVLDEQSGTPDGVAGIGDTAPEQPENSSTEENNSADAVKDTENETVSIPEKPKKRKRAVKEEAVFEDSENDSESTADELPPVDYSGYTKTELIETLVLLIDNRAPAEIKNDVDRIKSLFYRKLKHESEERKNKFLEEGGKLEECSIPGTSPSRPCAIRSRSARSSCRAA